jgi:hypothetical protein
MHELLPDWKFSNNSGLNIFKSEITSYLFAATLKQAEQGRFCSKLPRGAKKKESKVLWQHGKGHVWCFDSHHLVNGCGECRQEDFHLELLRVGEKTERMIIE